MRSNEILGESEKERERGKESEAKQFFVVMLWSRENR